jgi:hypothetical protein
VLADEPQVVYLNALPTWERAWGETRIDQLMRELLIAGNVDQGEVAIFDEPDRALLVIDPDQIIGLDLSAGQALCLIERLLPGLSGHLVVPARLAVELPDIERVDHVVFSLPTIQRYEEARLQAAADVGGVTATP